MSMLNAAEVNAFEGPPKEDCKLKNITDFLEDPIKKEKVKELVMRQGMATCKNGIEKSYLEDSFERADVTIIAFRQDKRTYKGGR